MEQGRFIIPTLSGFNDVFRPAATKKNNQAFLFNPQDVQYQLKEGVLMLDGHVLSLDELIQLACDVTVNHPIEENVLIYGVFSYLALRKGLAYHSVLEISVTDISRFFNVTMGEKGFRLLEKLQSLETVYGVIVEPYEVFPLLTVERVEAKLRVTSEYMYLTFKAMMAISLDASHEKPYYFTDLAHANLVAERDKVAALIVIELVRLIVTAGRKQPHISFFTLERYVPQLRATRESATRNSTKNRDLKRIFSLVYRLLESKTELVSTFIDLSTNGVIPTVNRFHEVINVKHGGYRQSK